MAESEKVELRKLEGAEKTQLLNEMGRTVSSRIVTKVQSIEEAARLNAKRVSGSKQFKADQKRIEKMVKAGTCQEKKLVKPVQKKSKAIQKKMDELQKQIDRLETEQGNLWGKHRKEQAKRDQKRNKELGKFQAAMHKKYDDPMMYVDFKASYKGSIFVNAVEYDLGGMRSDNKAVQKSMDAWLEFRVKVIADPNWNGLREDFDKFVERL